MEISKIKEEELKQTLNEKKNSEKKQTKKKNSKKSVFYKKLNRFFQYCEINVFILGIIGLSQGFTNIIQLAIDYLYKDYYKLSPSLSSSFSNIGYLPTNLRFFYGFISDTFPILGYRRKPYIIIMNIVSIVMLLILYLFDLNVYSFLAIVIIFYFSSSFINTVAEALIIESSRNLINTKIKTQDYIFAFFSMKMVGYLIMSYFSGVLIQKFGERRLFLLSIVFPFIILMSSFFMKEDKYVKDKENQEKQTLNNIMHTSNLRNKYDLEIGIYKVREVNNPQIKRNKLTIKSQIKTILNDLRNPKILMTLIYLFIYSICPGYYLVLFFFFTNILKFPPIYISNLKVIMSVSIIVGMLIYKIINKKIGFKTNIITCLLLNIFNNVYLIFIIKQQFLFDFIPIYGHVLIHEIIKDIVGELLTMPLIVLAVNMCPSGVEGSLYSLFMAIMNVGYILSAQIEALITYYFKITSNNFTNFPTCLIVTIGFQIVDCIITYFFVEKDFHKKQSDKRSNSFLYKNNKYIP